MLIWLLSAIENAPVLWGMSDVSPGRICKFNSAAGANVQSCGDYFPPSPPPALGKFANLIPPFPTSVYLKNLTMVFKDFHKSTLTNQSVALEKKRGGPIKLQKKYLTLLKIFLLTSTKSLVCQRSIRAAVPPE